MRNLSLICLFCVSVSILKGQDNNIVIGKIDSVYSEILDEQRKIWVYSPDENSDGIFRKQSYPVVYLLDGDAHFYSVVGMIRQLSAMNGNTIMPKMIIVGIPNTYRTRDLTPTKGTPSPMADPNLIADSGGGEKFMSFIEKELMPYINSNYPTQSYRMLIGHSFGGLTAMNTLTHHPELFDAYVSIDPSMWWTDRKLLNEIKQKSFITGYENKKLFLGIANTMNEGMDIMDVHSDTTFQTEHIRSVLELKTYLEKNSENGLVFKGKYYENDDHGSVPLITEYDAFRFIFDFYRLKMETQDFLDPESDFLSKIVSHYKKLSEEFRIEIKPDEAYINGFGYQFMSMNQLKKAEEFFKLNVANYPDSFNVYDSIGDFYAEQGEKEKAIENYRKSIDLNKDSFSKEKLKQLENE